MIDCFVWSSSFIATKKTFAGGKGRKKISGVIVGEIHQSCS
jgi:hypothetical protein